MTLTHPCESLLTGSSSICSTNSLPGYSPLIVGMSLHLSGSCTELELHAASPTLLNQRVAKSCRAANDGVGLLFFPVAKEGVCPFSSASVAIASNDSVDRILCQPILFQLLHQHIHSRDGDFVKLLLICLSGLAS